MMNQALGVPDFAGYRAMPIRREARGGNFDATRSLLTSRLEPSASRLPKGLK
jgi:hypothetical protein